MARSKQSRNVVCISYAPLSVILSAFDRHRDNIKAWAYIRHDKDVDENGELLEPHFHIILRFYRSFSHSTIKRWFACFNEDEQLINTHVMNCSDVGAYFDYLIHTYDKDKYQYDPSLRKCSDPRDFVTDEASNTDNLSDALEDLLNHVSTYDLCKKYGRDFIIHSRLLFELADRIRCERSHRSEAQFKEVNSNPF